MRQFYVILFIHIRTRQILVTPATMHPKPAWVSQQASNVSMMIEDADLPARYVLRDRDGKFQGSFDDIMNSNGIKPVVLPRRSPNLNAFAVG